MVERWFPHPSRADNFKWTHYQKSVEDAASVSGGLWLSYLFVLSYIAIAAGAVTHDDLLLVRPVKLPFLNVELPLKAFFALAPFVVLIIHAYALMHFIMLGNKASRFHNELRRQFPYSATKSQKSGAAQDGAHKEIRDKLRRLLPSNIFVQILAGPPELRTGIFGSMLKLIALTTLVVFPVLVLLLLQIQFLPFHDVRITNAQRVALMLDIVVLWLLRARRSISRSCRARRSRLRSFRARCSNQAQLQGASLRAAQLQGASLVGADFNAADYSHAFLWRTDWGEIDPAELGAVRLDAALERWKSVWLKSDWKKGISHEFSVDPWDAKAYADLRVSMNSKPEGERVEALKPIEKLDCANPDKTLASCDPAAKPPPNVLDWQKKLLKANVDNTAFQKALATELRSLVCVNDADAIHILRGTIESNRLSDTEREAPALVDYIMS